MTSEAIIDRQSGQRVAAAKLRTQSVAASGRNGGGLHFYVVTPYDEHGDVETGVLDEYLTEIARSGVTGVTCIASTCEGPYLTDAERGLVVDTIGKRIGGRIELNVGVGALSTRQAIEYAQHARDAGATCLMLDMPQYFPITFEAAYRHYEAVANVVPLPIRLYNITLPTRFDFTPERVLAMADIAAIHSIKDASGDVTRLRDIRMLCGDRFALHCGLHFQALDGFRLGADGWEVMTHPVITQDLIDLHEALRADPWSPRRGAEVSAAAAAFSLLQAVWRSAIDQGDLAMDRPQARPAASAAAGVVPANGIAAEGYRRRARHFVELISKETSMTRIVSNRRSIVLGGLAAGGLVSWPLIRGAAHAQQKAEHTMVFASTFSDATEHQVVTGVDLFKQLAEKYSQGRLHIDYHGGGKLGGQNVLPQKVQQGAIQGCLLSMQNFTPYSESFNLLDFPYLFASNEAFERFLESPLLLQSQLISEPESKNMKVLVGMWANSGLRTLGISKKLNREIHLPADLKGVKIRVTTSKVEQQAFELTPGNAVSINWAETYQAMQQGAVDALNVGLGPLTSARVHETIGTATRINMSFNAHVSVVNKRWFDALPAPVRDAIERARKGIVGVPEERTAQGR